jgi:hypothetical protein
MTTDHPSVIVSHGPTSATAAESLRAEGFTAAPC